MCFMWKTTTWLDLGEMLSAWTAWFRTKRGLPRQPKYQTALSVTLPESWLTSPSPLSAKEEILGFVALVRPLWPKQGPRNRDDPLGALLCVSNCEILHFILDFCRLWNSFWHRLWRNRYKRRCQVWQEVPDDGGGAGRSQVDQILTRFLSESDLGDRIQAI